MAKALDELGRAYGKAPHEWLTLDPVLTAFDYEVLALARTNER